MHSLPSPREIARLLGGEAWGKNINAPAPGHSPKDRSLSVELSPDDPDGLKVRYFGSKTDWKTCKDHVRERLGLEPWQPSRPRAQPKPLRPSPPPPKALSEDDAARAEIPRGIWNSAGDLRGTLGETYLRNRGLEVAEDLSHALRFHPELYFEGDRVPGLVALFRDVATGAACGVHRIFVTPDSHKIERRMLGRAKGAAVMLDRHEDVTGGLHIGEGIETCLAARMHDLRPTWALGSVGAIGAFPLLAGLECISVLTENDTSSAKHAGELLARYRDAGLEGLVYQPPRGDFNDILKGTV